MPLNRAEQHDLVLRVLETVSFVVGDEVRDGYPACAQRGDDVVGLGLHDADVVSALRDQQGLYLSP